MSDIAERKASSLDDDAVPGSQGEVDPGSEGEFSGEPMDREETLDRGTETGDQPSMGSEPPQPGG